MPTSKPNIDGLSWQLADNEPAPTWRMRNAQIKITNFGSEDRTPLLLRWDDAAAT